MKRYSLVIAGLLGLMLVLFALAEAIGLPVLTDPDPLQGRGRAAAALLGVALLVIDIVLPVPSSVVMLAHGAMFGVALGTGLSMVGSLGAFAVGFALGRRGVGLIARVVPDEERQRADRLLSRWGLVAIVLSRPVPMVAETMAFSAGASPLRWRSALGAATLGYLPAAAVYAVAGSLAVTFSSGAVVFLAVLVTAFGVAIAVRPRPVGPGSDAPQGTGPG